MRKFVTIGPPLLSDTKIAADLHLKTIPGISSMLGQLYLNKFYKTLIGKTGHMSLAAYADNHLVGIITTTQDISTTLNHLHKLFNLNIYLILFSKVITMQVSPLTIFGRIRFEKYQDKSYKKPYASIVTFCVNSNYQRRGIGSSLIRGVIKKAKEMGINRIYVDTRTTNILANKFYLKIGFRKQGHILGNVIFSKNV